MRLELSILSLLLILLTCSNFSIEKDSQLIIAEMNGIEQGNNSDTTLEFSDTCACSALGERMKDWYYFKYNLETNELFTGVCTVTRQNGDYLFYKYQKGDLIESIEYYKNGVLLEEIYYHLDEGIYKRNRFYANGNKSYSTIFMDHTYETFYESGRLERKGGYQFTAKDSNNLEEIHVFDSLWKETGEFDSIYYWSPHETAF